MEKQKYYITTAIAYTSGKPHIGNTYEVVLADAIARYKRQEGYDVFFQTGTDEHGQKIELKAAEAGITPKEFVDNVAGEIKRIWDLMPRMHSENRWVVRSGCRTDLNSPLSSVLNRRCSRHSRSLTVITGGYKTYSSPYL